MKARVKATGEIVEVEEYHKCLETGWKYKDNAGTLYKPPALDFSDEAVIDYWTRLEHQYAGMAMQGLMSYVEQITPKEGRSFCDEIVDISFKVAHALVEKLKSSDL